MSARDLLAAALGTVLAFAEGAGAERVVLLLDAGDDAPPVMIERVEDGDYAVMQGEEAVPVEPGTPVVLPPLRAVPATAVSADPETGELSAPLGSVQMLADGVLALARAFGGRSVATATFATSDPAVPLTVAAREGEPVLLDLAGRHYALPL
jgi:hypothetical protein